MKHILIFLLTLMFFPLFTMATHNNAGEILLRHIDTIPPVSATYEIRIVTYTNPKSLADRDSLLVRIKLCSSGSGDFYDEFWVKRVGISPVNPDIQKNEYVYPSYTFPSPTCYQVSMSDPNRIGGIDNISGSINVQFYLEDTLIIPDPQFFGFNSTPVLLSPPIDFAKVGERFVHNPNAFDPDGDSLHFSLIVPKQAMGTNVPGYWLPNTPAPQNTFTIDPHSGELVWDAPHAIGVYNVAILIREFRKGVFIGSMIRDMQIRVLNNPNNSPELSDVNDTCVIAGSPLQVMMTGTDPDPNDMLSLTAEGGPFFVNDPAVFTTQNSTSPVTGTFTWETTCNHIRPGFYTVVFKVSDNYTGPNNNFQHYVDVKTWQIRVVAPAPENVVTNTEPDRVEISWDPYQCASAPNFRGFTVWRKNGCDNQSVEDCMPGDLAQHGYRKISGFNPIQDHSFTDTDVQNGVVYSYRVQAEFAQSVIPGSSNTYNPVSSQPSEEACAFMPRHVPIITHVDVIATHNSAGAIDIKWMKPLPEDLDTLLNPGPYKYELFRSLGMNAGTDPELIASFTANGFSTWVDTFYTDSGLNTLESPYTYFLKFYASNNSGEFYEIGESATASSVFLSIASSGGQLALTWEEMVPWFNFEYTVYKQNISGTFDSLTTTSNRFFLDTQVEDGTEYCYLVKAEGAYFNPDVPEPLINHSQIACAIPMDTIPPCAPVLSVTNDCERGITDISGESIRNFLSWANPTGEGCEEEIFSYNIYYTPVKSEEFTLIKTLESGDDSVYIHGNLSSFAGCYMITALDSAGNESPFSNVVCVDNCPVYALPNVFTPNNDGSNDIFRPILPIMFVDKVDMKIYNRWGNLVYQTDDPYINWDGKDIASGRELSEGVYFYVVYLYEIKVEGIVRRVEPMKGNIHLLR